MSEGNVKKLFKPGAIQALGYQKFQIACKLGGGIETLKQLGKLSIDEFYDLSGYIIFENANREYQILSQRKGLEAKDRARLGELGRIRQAMDMGDGDKKLKELQERIDRLNMQRA